MCVCVTKWTLQLFKSKVEFATNRGHEYIIRIFSFAPALAADWTGNNMFLGYPSALLYIHPILERLLSLVKNDPILCLTAEKNALNVTPTLEKGKYCLYSYFHGICTPLGYKDYLRVIFDPEVKITVTVSQLQTSKNTHTHTHTHTHSADWSQTELKLSCAGVHSPFLDPIHNFQRSKFKLFQAQPSRPCLLTLVHSECKRAADDWTLSSLCAALQKSGTRGWSGCLFSGSGCGCPLRLPCWFMLLTFEYYWKRLHSKLLYAHMWYFLGL